MATDTSKLYVGFLLVVMIVTGAIITFQDDLQLRIDNDKSTFYSKNTNNRWIVVGREYNSLWSGASKLNRKSSLTNVSTVINELDDTMEITRYTHYKNGMMIKDTYLFDGTTTDVTKFPISHEIEIYNASGYTYQYEVRDLYYSGETKRIEGLSSMMFGYKMKVQWDNWNYYGKILKYKNKDEGKLTIKYRIEEDYVKISAKLFDPVDCVVPVNDTVYTDAACFENVTENYSNITFSCTAGDSQSYNFSAGENNWQFNCTVGCEFPEWKIYTSSLDMCKGTYYQNNYINSNIKNGYIDCHGSTLIGNANLVYGNVLIENDYNMSLRNCILNASNLSNQVVTYNLGYNYTFENNTLIDGKLYGLRILGIQNSTIKDSTIGEYCYRGINIEDGVTYNSYNITFENLYMDSKYNLNNTIIVNDIDDGIKIINGENLTFNNITLIDWGHTAYYITGYESNFPSNGNVFENSTISFTDAVDYGRCLGADGNVNFAKNNIIRNVYCYNQKTRSQINGHDNLIINVTINKTTNSPRDLPNKVGQALDMDDYGGSSVSENNTYINITTINTASYPIRVGTNVTGTSITNLQIFENQVEEDVRFVGDSGSKVIEMNFINSTSDDGTMNYRFQNLGGGHDITINETSTIQHFINLSNTGTLTLPYNGLKQISTINNSVTLYCDANSQQYDISSGENWVQNACDAGVCATENCTFPVEGSGYTSNTDYYRGKYYVNDNILINVQSNMYLDCNDATLIAKDTFTDTKLLFFVDSTNVTVRNCNFDANNNTNYPIFASGTTSAKITNNNLTGALLYALYLRGAVQSNISYSNIGLRSRFGLFLADNGVTSSDNNHMHHLNIKSGWVGNNSISDPLEDGVAFREGSGNILEDSNISNWGHSSIDCTGTNPSFCVNNNIFRNLQIKDGNVQYNRGIGTGGLLNCFQNNTFDTIDIIDTTVKNQPNGDDNFFYNIRVINLTDSTRELPDRQQAFDLDDSGIAENVNQTFENITIRNVESEGIRISTNVTNANFRNTYFENIGGSSEYYFAQTAAGSSPTTVSIFDSNSSNGIIRYNITTTNSEVNIISNETTSLYTYINLVGGDAKLIGDYRKELSIVNNTMTIHNTPTYNSYCNSTVAVCQQNIAPYTETISSGYSFLIKDDRNIYSVDTTVTDINYSRTDTPDITITYAGTGLINVTNLSTSYAVYLNTSYDSTLTSNNYSLSLPGTRYDLISSGINETLSPAMSSVIFNPDIAFYNPVTGRLEQSSILPENNTVYGYTYKVTNQFDYPVRLMARLNTYDERYKIVVNDIILNTGYQYINEPRLGINESDYITTLLDLNISLTSSNQSFNYDIFFIGVQS